MTRHQIDPRLHNDSDLARHLLTVRGVQWLQGERGVPLARILRAQDADPRVWYAELRGHPALRQSDLDVWVIAEHAVAAQVMADPGLKVRDPRFVRRRRRVYGLDADTTPKHVLAIDDATLALERDDHDRLRRLTEPVLGAAAMNARRTPVAAVFDEVAGDLTGGFDLMTDYATRGVIVALANVVGLPLAERPQFAADVMGAGHVLDALLCPPTLPCARRLVECFDRIKKTVAGLVGEGRGPDRAEQGTVLHELALLTGGEEREADTLAAILLTLVLGTHLTSNLICNAVLALLAHPDQCALLREDPSLAGAVVEETLRYDAPLKIVSRISGSDTDLCGVTVNAGDQVVVLIDAANRDPAAFLEPETFDLTRAGSAAHLTFDDFPARLVAPVVRMLATEAIRALVPLLPVLEPAGEVVRHVRSPVIGLIARCPVSTIPLR
ncbi:P450-derived glycosyltransferase activator [Nonomuraea sp. NPDC048826]|uniref:cytochrome P450 family protein n=1 Tax=Nonomuraea sp. NPDC048826 TaxID=3364347 RepID=UPI00371FB8B1